MSLDRSTNSAFAVLGFKKRLVLRIRAILSTELCVPFGCSQAYLTQIRPVDQLRELVRSLPFAAPVADCHAVPGPFVLDSMQTSLGQMMTDGPETNACPARYFSYPQASP